MEAEEPIHEHRGDDVDGGIEAFSRDEASEQRKAHGQLENVREHADGEGQFDTTRCNRMRRHTLTTRFHQQRFIRGCPRGDVDRLRPSALPIGPAFAVPSAHRYRRSNGPELPMRLSACQSPLVWSVGIIWAAVTAQPLAAQDNAWPQADQMAPARDCLGTKPLPPGLPAGPSPLMASVGGAVEDGSQLDGFPPMAIYRGEVVDTTDPKRHTHAIVRFAFCHLHSAGDGFFRIDSPFASHGVFYLQATRDSVRITTTSDSGARIVWSAKRKGHDLDGTYTLVRGHYPTQRGMWFVGLASGHAIPETVHGWP
jgi:hypothetical protein